MKYFITISLVFSFCFLSMRSTLVFSYFKWNQDYIAANLCINRAVKKSTCNGKCQLKQMMQATENGDQPLSIPIIPNLQLEHFFPYLESDLSYTPSNKSRLNDNAFSYPLLINRLPLSDVFHPPESFPFFV